jgi:transposase
MTKIKQILLMQEQGLTHRGISKALGLHRNTVSKYLDMSGLTGQSVPDLLRLSDEELEELLVPERVQLSASHLNVLSVLFGKLKSGTGKSKPTRMHVWEQYKSEYPEGLSYSSFCERYASYLKSSRVYLVQDHVPGDKLYCDFAGKKLRIIDPDTGKDRYVEVFVAVLGASNYMYVEAIETQQRPDVLRALTHALKFFGGAPQAIVPDNMKSLVDKGSKYEPKVNSEAEAFGNYYQTVILPTRPHRPKDKAKVEGAVRINYQWLYPVLESQCFCSLGELNDMIISELKKMNDRPMQEYKQSRWERFVELDQPVLKPLPDLPFEYKRSVKCTALANNHVYLKEDHHYYSIPYQYVRKTVKLVYSTELVEVYFEGKRIAAHPRNRVAKEGGAKPYTTLPEHLPLQHQYVLGRSEAYFLEAGEKIDPVVRTFMEGIFSAYKHPEQAYKSCEGILKLAKGYGRPRLIQACIRATSYGAFSYEKLNNILQNRLDLSSPLDNTPPPLPTHPNIRGADYYA